MTSMVEKSGFNGPMIWRLGAIVLLATLVGMAGVGVAFAQDATDQEAVTAAVKDVATAPAEQADNEAATEDAATDVAAEAQPETEGSNLEGFVMLALVIALFVVPMFLGNRSAKSLKMPDHGWKFALAIGTLAAAAVIVYFGEIKFGPDLSGGITLIYELQDTSLQEDEEEDAANGPNLNQNTIVNQLIIALCRAR